MLKYLLKKNKHVKSFALKIYFIVNKLYDGSIPFFFYQLFKIPFKYSSNDKKNIKFYPEGQISKRIFTNSFENEQLATFQRIIKPGMIVVDAGANIGLYTLIAANLVGNKGKVFSFEPSKETFERLNNNLRLNNFCNVTAVNIGLGENPNEKLILRQDVGYGDAERYLYSMNETHSIKLENVNELFIQEEIVIDTLDNYLNKLIVKKIDFLKIDTEGFEYYILKGSEQVLKNSPEVVLLMECTALGTARAHTSQKKVFDFLKELDFKLFYWNKKKMSWCNDEVGILYAGDIWACKHSDHLKFFSIN
ncbi:MAG: FkbM family methyltransferase [Sediminibacterium sp.]